MGIARTRAEQLLCLTHQNQAPISAHKTAAELEVHSQRADLPLTLPGFVARIHGTWYVYLNQYHGPRRRRWTLAHELGHIVLEHQGDVLYCGGRSFQEVSANRFAAELLMPKDLTRREHASAVRASLSVLDLADIFLVGKRAMELRLEELGLDL